jgi:hypothetical protein
MKGSTQKNSEYDFSPNKHIIPNKNTYKISSHLGGVKEAKEA